MQRRLIQTEVATLQVFLFCLKNTTHKPSKVAAVKNLSSSVQVIDLSNFDECFLPHLITVSHCFL